MRWLRGMALVTSNYLTEEPILYVGKRICQWSCPCGIAPIGNRFIKLIVATLESTFQYYDMENQYTKDGFVYLKEAAHRITVWFR